MTLPVGTPSYGSSGEGGTVVETKLPEPMGPLSYWWVHLRLDHSLRAILPVPDQLGEHEASETTTTFVDTNGTVPNPERSEPFPAWWVLDPAYPVGPDATALHLIVTESQCASAISPLGRIEATVHYSTVEVRVDVIVNSVGGNANCPGNPPTPFVVQLSEPLGNRPVIGQQPPP